MVENYNKFGSLVDRSELASVVMPNASLIEGASSLIQESDRKAVAQTRENAKLIADLKARLSKSTKKSTAGKGDKMVKDEAVTINAALDRIAQDPESMKELKAVVESEQATDGSQDDEAMNIAVQALSLRAALNAARQTNDPSEIADIRGKLDQLHSRANSLSSGNARDLATRVISSTQSYAATIAPLVMAAATTFLETIGSIASAVGDSVSRMFGGNSFFNSLDDKTQYGRTAVNFRPDGEIQFNPEGQIQFTKADGIRGDKVKTHFKRLNGEKAGINNPLLTSGKLQILEKDETLGTAAENAKRLEIERVEAGFMKESLTALEQVKTAIVLGNGADAKAAEKLKANRKLFKAAEDEMKAVLESRQALVDALEASDKEAQEKALKELQKAKAQLKTTLRKIADEVMGEAPAPKMSAATDVDGPASGLTVSTETTKKMPDPSRSGTTAGV